MKPFALPSIPSFYVAMSAETYRALQRAYAKEQRPQVRTLWDDLTISIDEGCAFGVVEHRKGTPP